MAEDTSYNNIIPAAQMAKVCRWARVAVTVRAAWRVAIRFHPDTLRDPAAANAAVMALDACTSLAAVAATNGRQLAQPVTDAAATAMLSAQAAPDQSPLSTSDHAALLAAVSVLMCGPSSAPAALDCGNPDNHKAAMEDLYWMLASGLAEQGHDYAVPREFFLRRLWPKTPRGWDRELEDWERRLAPLGQLDFSERMRWMRTGRGIDWTFAQRRAEVWVRANLAKWSAEQLAAQPQPSAIPQITLPPMPPSPVQVPVAMAAPANTPPAPLPEIETYLPRPMPLPTPPPAPVAESARHDALAAVIQATTPPPPSREPVPDLAPSLDIPSGGPFDFSDLEPWANALCGLIDFLDPRSTMTLAIQGPAGSGRSVIGGMVRRRLAGKPSANGQQPHLTFWFDASQPRDQPVMAAALLGELAAGLDKERSFWQRHRRRLAWSLLSKQDRYRQIVAMLGCIVAMLAAVGAAAVLTGILKPPDWMFTRRDFLNWARAVDFHRGPTPVVAFFGFVFLAGALELFGSVARMGGALARYVRHPEAEHSEAVMTRARAEIATLIGQAVPKGSRMVVFVEDPERSGPARSLEFLEHLDDFLGRPELVKILLTDLSVLAEHARARHQRQTGLTMSDSLLKQQLGRFIDMQVNLPARGAPGETRPKRGRESAKAKRRSLEHARGFDAFTGLFSRDWRGSNGFLDSLRRSMFVDPPYVSPVAGLWWLCMFLPGWVFASVQRWCYAPRCRRIFSSSKIRFWHLLLALTLVVHSVLVVQTINGYLSNRHFVILWPHARPHSLWVFLPLGLLNLFVVALTAVWSAFSARRRELKTLKAARAMLRRKIQEMAGARADAPQIAQELSGVTRVPNEQILIREAVEEHCLPSTRDVIERLELFMELSKGVI